MSARARVAVLGYYHESNTFASDHVTKAALVDAVLRGDEIEVEHDGAQTIVAGYLKAGREADFDLVPLSYIEVVPSGPALPDALEFVRDELVDAVASGGSWDALLVCLHGAAVATNVCDVDGYLLSQLREAVGVSVPIAVTLDLHANVTAKMVENSDILVGYRTNPHVDARERAQDATRILDRCLRQGWLPVTSAARLPIAINILAQGTDDEPMSGLMSRLDDVLKRPGVVTASLFEGYPYADTQDIGIVVVVSDRSDGERARQFVDELSASVWARRDAFDVRGASVEEALRNLADGTTLLLDMGDNIGGGSPGNSVEILRAAIDTKVPKLLTIVNDARAARACCEAGVGRDITCAFGVPSITVRARVERLSDGRYHDSGPTHVGHQNFDAGPTAVLQLESGQTVVLCSRAVMPSSTQQLTSVGIDVRDYRAVVAKGVHSPLASYGPHVDAAVWVDTPGASPARLEALTYQNRAAPLLPFEELDDDVQSSLTYLK